MLAWWNNDELKDREPRAGDCAVSWNLRRPRVERYDYDLELFDLTDEFGRFYWGVPADKVGITMWQEHVQSDGSVIVAAAGALAKFRLHLLNIPEPPDKLKGSVTAFYNGSWRVRKFTIHREQMESKSRGEVGEVLYFVRDGGHEWQVFPFDYSENMFYMPKMQYGSFSFWAAPLT